MNDKSLDASRRGIHPLKNPKTIKHGSVKVTIYPTWDRKYKTDPETGEKSIQSQRPQYTLSYYVGSQRRKAKFTQRKEAENEAQRVAFELAAGDLDAVQLKGVDRKTYERALQAANQLENPPPLDEIVRQYVAAESILKPLGANLFEAVKEYERRHKVSIQPKRVEEVVTELIEVKRKAGKSQRTLADLQRLTPFTKSFSINIHEVDAGPLQEYLDQFDNARTQLNHFRLIRMLFHFAVKHKYAGDDLLQELRALELKDQAPTKTNIFTPEELREALEVAPESLIPWLVVGGFAGLRTAEIARLDWDDVNLEDELILVRAENAKTRSRRAVPLSPNAIEWLRPFRKASGKILNGEHTVHPTTKMMNVVNEKRKADGKAEGFKWKPNGLRHSFCSYRLAILQDPSRVAYEAGNSPKMIFRHYHELVSRREAEAWFGIRPIE